MSPHESIEDPWALLRRLKLGREEFCQRLLTMLILEGAYPRWNTRSRPSDRGLTFVRQLDVQSFGDSDVLALHASLTAVRRASSEEPSLFP